MENRFIWRNGGEKAMDTRPVALVTGSPSGFGFLTAIELIKAGYYVIASMRNLHKADPLLAEVKKLDKQDHVEIIQMDVTDSDAIQRMRRRIEEIGRIDLLVNNAGFALGGFAEEVSNAELRKQFDTNFFGLVEVTQNIIPLMRERGSGRIINISSTSGLIGFPALSSYVASKYALEGYSESLRLELKPFNIDVILIEPGSFKTNIWTLGRVNAEQSLSANSPYLSLRERIEQLLLSGQDRFGEPIDVAKLIVKVATVKRPRLRYPIGKGVKMQILLKRLLSWKSWEKQILRMIVRKNS
jgi:NAD(P)-dependent dehydrogenase (short-subunit alcohol dehydrogenase family)